MPNNRILQYHTGNRRKAELGGFELELNLTARESCQIRHTALEAARVISNATIRNAAGVDGYSLKIHTYPHHVLRETNKQQEVRSCFNGYETIFWKECWYCCKSQRGQVIISLKCTPKDFYRPNLH